MAELPDALYDRVTEICEEADEFLNYDRYADALEKYTEAWELLPEPKRQWDAATFLMVGVGDTQFFQEHYAEALAAFTEALACPEGLGNPFVHLRLGEAHFDLGDLEHAGEELTRAYEAGGPDIFEEEDPKYFDLVRQLLNLPADEPEP